MYAQVIIDITHEKLDRVFEYRVPSGEEERFHVGMEVWVPFGKGNREMRGYIVGFCKTCSFEETKVKELLRPAEGRNHMEEGFIRLAAWMREHYGGTMVQALKTVLPVKKETGQQVRKTLRLAVTKEEGEKRLQELLQKNQKARARLLAALLDSPELSYELVTKKLHVTKPVVESLKEMELLQVEEETFFREPITKGEQNWKPPVYTKEQTRAIEAFWQDYRTGRRDTYLLYGVTGSGKTEVYMEMIGRVIESGRQAIVLIPEIALTYQTVMRFYGRFGNRVSILNSRMSDGERYDQMMRAKAGELDVMIGPRSALFTPFPNLGLIVVDEEHESTYKSEQIPRYHARETAIARAQMEDASVILGSATPSLEAYYRAEAGQYQMLRLTERAKGQALPTVHTVDLREELKSGNRSIISGQLRTLMEERLEKKQQVMLFLNRRGFAGFVSCRACGYVAKCPHCDVSLSSHRGGRLVCHYCGYEEPAFHICPECGSPYIGSFKAGTQQIEELVKKEFPDARVLRMDMDTTRHKDDHEKILEAFSSEEADILIGTQMIVKGHDFPNVTLVGILAADLSLYAEDYRAGERTFQLLTQAAGRAGRGREPGEVVIQTYSPEHYSIETAARQDYEAFYEEEIAYRKLMGYPPASNLLAILLTGKEETYLETACKYMKQYAERVGKGKVTVIGPASPHVGKVKDIYRRVLYLKHEEYDILIHMKNKLEQYMEVNSGFAKIRVQFDFNPMNLF